MARNCLTYSGTEGCKYAEITEFFLRYIWIKGTSRLKYIDKYLYKYYRTEGSHSMNRVRLEKQRKEVLLKYAQRFSLDIDDLVYYKRDVRTGAHKYIPITSDKYKENIYEEQS